MFLIQFSIFELVFDEILVLRSIKVIILRKQNAILILEFIQKKMKKQLLILITLLLSSVTFAQDDCYTRLENAFKERGSLSVSDDIHSNVIICFFDDEETRCVGGKVRVDNGTITSVFLQFEDDTYDMMTEKFYSTAKRMPPTINNGISEMIQTARGEKFKVVFIKKLKPKKKAYKQINLPDDL